MIPKIIHYAWFGSELPEKVQLRVNTWKKVMPDWDFKFWNEKNYDLGRFEFSYEMYKQKKLGFVTDELRYDVLNEFGGLYLDTDMIIKKILDSILNHNMVWGFQYDNSLATEIIASQPNQKLLQDILNVYDGSKFPDIHKQLNDMTSNPIITKIFLNEFDAFKTNGVEQLVGSDIMIYPKDYFIYLSRNSDANYAEHLFDNSWGSNSQGIYGEFKLLYKKLFPYSWAKISAKRGITSAEIDGIPLYKE